MTCEVCNQRPFVHTHHRKLRAQGGSDDPTNLLKVCLDCHTWIHANPSESYARGLLVHSWADPVEVEIYAEPHEEGDDHELSPKDEAEHHEFVKTVAEEHDFPLSDWQPTIPPQPGETCTSCKRRVPHEAKASTPKSRVWSTRVPLEAETFSELVDAAAEHHGLTSKPYHRYWILHFGVVALLQMEKGELPV